MNYSRNLFFSWRAQLHYTSSPFFRRVALFDLKFKDPLSDSLVKVQRPKRQRKPTGGGGGGSAPPAKGFFL